ncbi:GGDEF domain-containing protein [Thauera humireducens]|uniref:GGDEF domain-containing protein n=1 Tax=Thauera humireducens TaxID=1134435 RepID=UPI00311D4712
MKFATRAVLRAIAQNLAQAALAANESNAALKKSLEATEQETRLLRGELDKHRREAMVDPLTGLLNRRGMLIEAAKLFDSSDGPPALLVMDIDHFKRINDTYGHAVGDIVIQKVAEAMLAIAPDQAMTARFGGEEFVMLVPNASIDRAQQLAEKVRTSIERLRLVRRHDKLEIAPFTISVGVALRQREESIEPLFDRADKALYRAKHNGRNCVVASS